MKNGYWGKVLRINLTMDKITIEDVPEKIWKQVVGGAGYGAKVILGETNAGIDPLSPENKIIFAVGCYQAIKSPGSAKWSVVTKSPLTKTYLDSAGGGYWGVLFKKSGYDAMIIEGRSKNPVYIRIIDNMVKLKDASHIWGMDNYEVNNYLQGEFGKHNKVSTLTIGPSGEMLNPIACITADGHSFAGRGGSGAVMGSKNLKAIVVSGNKDVAISIETESHKNSLKVMRKLAKDGKNFRNSGTAWSVPKYEALGEVPIKYWTGETWTAEAKMISGPIYNEMLDAKPHFCANCPVGCHRYIKLKEPEKWKLEGPGPEYETLGMMGANLLNKDLTSICKANDICNRYGIDTISTGAFIGFLMECYEKNIITKEDTNGLEIKWGSGEVLVKLTEQIANLEGLGKLFENGIIGASQKIGEKETKDLIVHVKNLDLPAHDPRAVFGIAVNYATGTRGACHERGDAQAISLGNFFPEIMERTFNRFSMEEAPQAAVIAQDTSAFFNSVSLCKFMVKAVGMTLTEVQDIFNAITGWNWSIEEILNAGKRIITLQRLINIRDGIRRKDDCMPAKIFQPANEGPRKGKIPTPFEPALEEYYRLRGWDKEGIPTKDILIELGLEEYVKYLPNLGK
jgi:aldehyde:ferredoxin oxidoreductase